MYKQTKVIKERGRERKIYMKGRRKSNRIKRRHFWMTDTVSIKYLDILFLNYTYCISALSRSVYPVYPVICLEHTNIEILNLLKSSELYYTYKKKTLHTWRQVYNILITLVF